MDMNPVPNTVNRITLQAKAGAVRFTATRASPAESHASNRVSRFFESFAQRATKVTGSSTAFLLALATVLIWIVTGPIFHDSDTWQLVINTGTTIVTFLMAFLIQNRADASGAEQRFAGDADQAQRTDRG